MDKKNYIYHIFTKRSQTTKIYARLLGGWIVTWLTIYGLVYPIFADNCNYYQDKWWISLANTLYLPIGHLRTETPKSLVCDIATDSLKNKPNILYIIQNDSTDIKDDNIFKQIQKQISNDLANDINEYPKGTSDLILLSLMASANVHHSDDTYNKLSTYRMENTGGVPLLLTETESIDKTKVRNLKKTIKETSEKLRKKTNEGSISLVQLFNWLNTNGVNALHKEHLLICNLIGNFSIPKKGEEAEKLKRSIRNLSEKNNIQLNIIHTGQGRNIEFYRLIESFFDMNFVNYIEASRITQSNTIPLLLFSSTIPVVRNPKNRLIFYYDQYIQRSESCVILENKTNDSLLIGLVANEIDEANRDVISWGIAGEDSDKDGGSGGRMYAGEFSPLFHLSKYENIKISLSRNFDQNMIFPNHRLFLYRQQKSTVFSIPFSYQKRLPNFVSLALLVLEIFIIITTLFWVMDRHLISDRIYNWIKTKGKNLSVQQLDYDKESLNIVNDVDEKKVKDNDSSKM